VRRAGREESEGAATTVDDSTAAQTRFTHPLCLTKLGQVNFAERVRTETVNICDAKAQLSGLIQQAADGKDVIIGRNGKPVARLTQLAANKRVIAFGLLKGKMSIADDFDAPLPKSILDSFESRQCVCRSIRKFFWLVVDDWRFRASVATAWRPRGDHVATTRQARGNLSGRPTRSMSRRHHSRKFRSNPHSAS